jgi:hypothetical protein
MKSQERPVPLSNAPLEVEPQVEWWWVVEYSDYIRKQYPGTPRYTVVPISRLDEYQNILCKVRYSSEAAANAANAAANIADDGGDEILCAWAVVRRPASFVKAHPERSRYEAVSEKDIHKFESGGGKISHLGLSHADAVQEAARRCTLPEHWCVIPNDDGQRKSQEPYTVKAAGDLSSSERDQARATCDSEQDAWQAIPRIKAEDDEILARRNREEMEWRRDQHRWEGVSRIFRLVFVGPLILVLTWLLVSVVRWFWAHPLF